MTIVDRDNGYQELLRRKWGVAVATVGVHANDGAEVKEGSGDITVAEVAAIHEYGLGVPERSWLRKFCDENEGQLRKMLSAAARQIASGKVTEEVAMRRFGLAVVGMIKKRIVAGIEPELEESTKEAKARMTGGPKDTPLILFSQFISSIAEEIEIRSRA